MDTQQGFTLVEILVIVAIIGVMTAIVVRIIPGVRESQLLVSDTARLQLLLREAERRAVNELRSRECLDRFATDPDRREKEKRCSDVGLALQLGGSQVVMFADTSGDNNFDESNDFRIQQEELRVTIEPSVPGDEGWQTFLFKHEPPEAMLFYDGQPVSPDGGAVVTIRAGSQAREINIFPFRHIDDPE